MTPESPTPAEQAVEAAKGAAEAVEVSRQEQADSLALTIAQELREWRIQHELSEEDHRKDMKKAIANLATKDDIKAIKEFIKTVDFTFKIIRGGGRWGKTVILTTASLIAAAMVITVGFKAFIAAIGGWAVNK